MKKSFNLEEYKQNIKKSDTPLKKDQYVQLNEALQATIGLPGLPLGHITQIFGLSDSGKTSLVFHAAAQAQKQGILPIFIITENKVSWDRAALMGVNSETAIIENCTYIEDVFVAIDKYLADQASGALPMDIMFFVDSIGNTVSIKSVTENDDGTSTQGGAMMATAKVIRERMRVFTHKINNTRKVSSPKTAGLVFINHAYTKPPAFPGGVSTTVPYGGDGIFYAASLILKTKKTKVLKATVDGVEKGFGIITKLVVEKNHISNVTNMSDFVVVANDIIPNDPKAIKDYKEEHKVEWTQIRQE